MTTFLPSCRKAAGSFRRAGRSLLLLAGLGLPALASAQIVAFPRNAPFTGTDASGFLLGENAYLTAQGSSPTGGTPRDAVGSGTLRLTDAVGNQKGYAIDNSVFSTPNGFSISFEFFSYGTTTDPPADGFTVFLVDGKGTKPDKDSKINQFVMGGFGGSLGYAPRYAVEPGVTKGYLGIGIDEFGNYGIPSENKTGGFPGTNADSPKLRNAVSLRGPYDSTDVNRIRGYAYLAGSNTLPFSLAAGTSPTNQGSRITDPTNDGYRKAYINVIPVTTNGVVSYKITVRIQNGQNVATAINNFTVDNPPNTLRVGFGASTGGNNSIHEIRGLEIVKAPIAVDDNAQTKYNQPVIIGVLNNDRQGDPGATGAEIDPKSVDLNPNTIGTDASYTVAGQGTFTVNNNGVVTFTPTGTFSGTVSVPYTIRNLNENLSNLGTITVVVTGADVQTVLSGPAAVNPGTTTSYAVTTTNNGQETATNVTPTLTLPAGATYVSGGTLNGNTVSFPQATLTTGQSVTNSVLLTWPTAGSYVLTSNYAYPPGALVPDAVAANNASTLNVSVRGSANVAGVCAVPGKDGPVTLTATSQPNTYYPGVTAAQGSTTITVGTTPTGNTTTPIAKGDLLLLMQMQGAAINTANTNAYGTVTGTPTAGTYEYAVAASPVSATGSLTLVGKLTNAYTTNTSGNTFQVIRIPQYSSLTVSGAVTGLAWNGATGGVLALEVAGATSFNTGASLNMDGKGFRGGAALINAIDGANDTYVSLAGSTYASKGEGIAGSPFQVYSNNAASSGGIRTYQDYAGGSYARGQAATGGGGGNRVSGYAPGGGGGANSGGAGSDGQGASSLLDVTTALGGTGGKAAPAAPVATLPRLYLGGGGGAGVNTTATFLPSSGGTGGGIILLRSGSVSGTAAISANGSNGQALTALGAGGGGGGAGGTLAISIANGSGTVQATANGGDGGNSQNSGNGGGGGGGTTITSATTNLNANSTNGGSQTGANQGGGGARIRGAIIGGDCLPALTTTLRTTTPTVTRSANMQATYVYMVSNTGGGITGLTATPGLAVVATASGGNVPLGAPNLFKYSSTTSAVVRLTDNTTQTLTAGTDYTVNSTNAGAPVFTLAPGYVVPAGASVTFTFVASVDNAVTNSTAYGSNATGTYLNPQRTTAASTTTTATPNYTTSATGTSADVVTIVTPLPVKLTKFTAVAVGADAVLSWTTAQEVNNHHFEVERSLDNRTFESVGTVAGRGTTTLTSGYGFTDAGASTHSTGVLYYRLRQVDYDGQASFSPVQTVRFRFAGTNVSLYPNPTTGSATLDLSLLPAGDYTVEVVETTGRRVLRGTYQPGKQTLLLNGLATGTYFVKVQGASFNLVLPLSKQ